MSAATEYFERVTGLLAKIRESETARIEEAAEICARSIASGGLIFLFGAGHSRMMAEEMIPRQGSFPGFFALTEASVSNHASILGVNSLRTALNIEKYEGHAEHILKAFNFGPNDAFILISTSGIRPLIVEMGIGAKERGLPVIALCSREYCRTARAGHSSGRKLIDVADVVIDNQAPPGDCVIELEGLEWRTGPVSTVTGGMIVNMLRCATAERLLASGFRPELLPSVQFVGNSGADEQLERFYEAYRKSLVHLYE